MAVVSREAMPELPTWSGFGYVLLKLTIALPVWSKVRILGRFDVTVSSVEKLSTRLRYSDLRGMDMTLRIWDRFYSVILDQFWWRCLSYSRLLRTFGAWKLSMLPSKVGSVFFVLSLPARILDV